MFSEMPSGDQGVRGSEEGSGESGGWCLVPVVQRKAQNEMVWAEEGNVLFFCTRF